MRKFINILLLSFSFLLLSAIEVDIPGNTSKKVFEHSSFGLEKTEIEFNLTSYSLDEIHENGTDFSSISIPESGSQYAIGKPDLPKMTKIFAVPDQGKVILNFISSEIEYIENIKIAPFQNENRKTPGFDIDTNYYQEGNIFPSNIIELGTPAVMRDVRLVTVSVNPFQYDPQNNRVVVHKNIQMELVATEEPGINEKTTTRNSSHLYNSFYKNSVENSQSLSLRDNEFTQPGYLFIYPNSTEVLDNLELLTEWREKMGFDVSVVSTATTGSSAYQIKDYIQNAYDNWPNPPEFVCLVGDASGSFSIPTEYMSGGEGDQFYTLLEGDDILADVFIGRLSFNSISEFQTILSKIINYEKNPYTGNTEWYNKALLIGDPSSSGPSTIDCNLYVKDIISNNTDNFSFIENYSGGYTSTIATAIDNGVSYFNYRGYLNMSGWSDSNTSALNNGFMLPVAIILTCGTGSFASGTARSEYFVKAGSPTVPKGAIASVGTATISTHTMFNNCVSGGIYHGIFAENIYHMGGALTRGKLHLFETYPNLNYNGAPVYRFSYWNNLMGEPAMPLWTDVPETMVVDYPDVIGLGTNFIEISVTDLSDTPLENTWVTIMNDDQEIYLSGLTNTQGSIIFDLPENVAGNVSVVATRHNFVPFEDDFSIQVINENIAIDNYVINDENGDNLINPGETVTFDVTLKNTGMSSVSGINVNLSCDNTYITINDNTESFGSIDASENVTVTNAFSITAEDNLPGGLEIRLDLNITDSSANQWQEIIMEYMGAPKLDCSGYTVYDSDGIINPGETADISINLTNIGSVNAQNVAAVLNCSNGNITINDSLGTYSLITVGNESNNNTDRFNITVNSYMIPGSQIPFNLYLADNNGYEETIEIILELGQVNVTDPVGPDAYGYYCYDSGDTDYLKCPSYDWIEIASNQGGPGTSFGFSDSGNHGDTETIDLDINFQFYGETYDQISVCTNGWISPGENESESFMNWNIPGPLGPSPMIAPFWDDLKTSSGNVYYYYDQIMQYMVIQWENMVSDFSGSSETFQVILYDSYAYPTTTGDSEILFQYKNINNDSAGSYDYPYNHGQYCTVGLEDPTGTIGLEYTFNNTYPAAAKTLENEMAILFTSPPIPLDGPYITLYDHQTYSGDDYFMESGESVLLSLTLENIGPDAATNLDVTINCNDPYLTINDDSETVVSIQPNQQLTIENAFSFDIAASTPDMHSLLINVNYSSVQGTWESVIPMVIYEPNAISTNPMEFDVTINPESQSIETFTINNIGNGILQYTLRTEEIDNTSNLRNITGSHVYPIDEAFTPGETTTWTFYAFNGSSDNEWIKDVYIEFPQGINVLGASNMIGGSGGDMIYDGTTGSGAGIHWHGETDLGYGYLHQNQTGIVEIDVEITTEIAGNLTINYVLEGDGYGDAPHTIEGSFLMTYPLRWISLASSSGTINNGQSDDIEITFDTTDLEIGNYYCNIFVNSTNSWDTRVVPVTLHVDYVDSPEQTIPMKTELMANYPNPFNPETKIAFSLNHSSNVNLTIYNIKGEKVKTLVNKELEASDYTYTWTGKDDNNRPVASGIYLYKLDTDGYQATRKMILMK